MKPPNISTLHFFALLLLITRDASGNFGDYADLTFQCPAFTTCPQACVTDVANCPSSMTCPDGSTLCVDGSCTASANDVCSSDLVSPCDELSYPSVACPKVNDYYDSCLEKYQETYDFQSQYAEDLVAETTTMLTFKEPVFIFCYIWISAVTAFIVLWCAYNQRFSPVPGSTKPLQEATGTDISKTLWTQTGYRSYLLGNILYAMVCVTIAGFQVLLAIVTVFYYAQQGLITWCPVAIQDEQQALLCFIIVWMVGFFWTFALKWPASMTSLFLRRCSFENATHIAVCAPTTNNTTEKSSPTCGASCMSSQTGFARCVGYSINYFFGCLGGMSSGVNTMMKFVFSDTTTPKENWQLEHCRVINEKGARFFYYRLRRYTFDPEVGAFVPGDWVVGSTLGDFVALKNGLCDSDVQKRLSVVGPNSIRIKKPSFLKSILRQFSSKFYNYQFFIIWAWVPLWYYYMAVLYFLIVTIGGFTVAFFQYENEASLYKLTHMSGTIDTLRNGEYKCLEMSELVPGDVVALKPGITYCDMVLLRGSRLVVDESALTGESTPVSKTAIDPHDIQTAIYSLKAHKRQTILAGTTIVECSENDDLGLVTKTSSYTSRGEMLREILSFGRHKFKFDTEVEIVLVILVIYGIFGFLMTGFVLIKDSWIYGWFYGIYVLAASVPALLPTVFVVSVGVSNKRLAKKRIACVNSENILVAGKVKKALFDKTGTLTKQGLDFLSARSKLGWNSNKDISLPEVLETGMSCCHTLVQTNDGTLVGNSMDKIMFEAAGAKMSGSTSEQQETKRFLVTKADGKVITVLKRFDFDHDSMTQSVIAQTPDGEMLVFVKGSPESIKRLCDPDSLPNGFDTSVKASAKEGVYQIAMAVKKIEPGSWKMSRSEVECNLAFIGVISFKNILREESSAVLKQLEEGDIYPIMVTGDNILTGICVAKECNMIKTEKVLIAVEIDENGNITWVDESDSIASPPSIENKKTGELDYELAMMGSVWETILEKNRQYALELVEHVRVYGRCTPDNKISVISALIDKGYITSMCGDGGNDCGALKTAHVGIALSDAEASMVAPFTSIDKTITSVVEVLREGRCALASALASYKYMIMYGQVEAMNQMLCAYFQVTFYEWNWVFMDGFWVISMAFTLPLSKAASKLSPERPTSSILGAHTMFSACGVLALNFTFMIIALAALFHQDWYLCRRWGSTNVSSVTLIADNYEAETLFLVTGYQYISSAMAFNFGYTFRSAWIKNYTFVALALGFTIIQFYIALVPGYLSCVFRVNCSNDDVVRGVTSNEPLPIQNPFNTTIMPVSFRWILVIIMASNTVAIMGYELFIVNGVGKRIAKGDSGQRVSSP